MITINAVHVGILVGIFLIYRYGIDVVGSFFDPSWYGRKMQWYGRWWGWVLPRN